MCVPQRIRLCVCHSGCVGVRVGALHQVHPRCQWAGRARGSRSAQRSFCTVHMRMKEYLVLHSRSRSALAGNLHSCTRRVLQILSCVYVCVCVCASVRPPLRA